MQFPLYACELSDHDDGAEAVMINSAEEFKSKYDWLGDCDKMLSRVANAKHPTRSVVVDIQDAVYAFNPVKALAERSARRCWFAGMSSW